MPTSYSGAVTADPGAWQATHSYSGSGLVRPTSPNGLIYITQSGGTSGGSEPTWPKILGNTVVDGGVTWRCYGDLPLANGTPTITIPTNGDTGVPQAIVVALTELTDWVTFAAKFVYGVFSTANTWSALQTFSAGIVSALSGATAILGHATGSTGGDVGVEGQIANGQYAVWGHSTGTGVGVRGDSASGAGGDFASTSGTPLLARAQGNGVLGNLNIQPVSVAPTTPLLGDMYVNSATGHFYVCLSAGSWTLVV